MTRKTDKASRKTLYVITSLVIVLSIVAAIGFRYLKERPEIIPDQPNIDFAVRRLLATYEIDTTLIKKRKILRADKKSVRIEQRILVPAEFNSISFNRDLNQAVAHLGVTVVATEKSEDKSVTMHVKKDDVIVESFVFLVKKKEK